MTRTQEWVCSGRRTFHTNRKIFTFFVTVTYSSAPPNVNTFTFHTQLKTALKCIDGDNPYLKKLNCVQKRLTKVFKNCWSNTFRFNASDPLRCFIARYRKTSYSNPKYNWTTAQLNQTQITSQLTDHNWQTHSYQKIREKLNTAENEEVKYKSVGWQWLRSQGLSWAKRRENVGGKFADSSFSSLLAGCFRRLKRPESWETWLYLQVWIIINQLYHILIRAMECSSVDQLIN